jgi:hypothetical protein
MTFKFATFITVGLPEANALRAWGLETGWWGGEGRVGAKDPSTSLRFAQDDGKNEMSGAPT